MKWVVWIMSFIERDNVIRTKWPKLPHKWICDGYIYMCMLCVGMNIHGLIGV